MKVCGGASAPFCKWIQHSQTVRKIPPVPQKPFWLKPCWLKPFLARDLRWLLQREVSVKICFFLFVSQRAWCDVDGLRSRSPKGGRRSSVAGVHQLSSGLQQIVAAKKLRSASRQPLRPKGRSQPDVKSKCFPLSKVGRLEAALKVLGEEQSEARAVLEEALRKARAEGPNRSTPQDRIAEASARVTRLEAALQLLGEDSLVALEQARGQARLRPVGERLDSCLQFIDRVKKQIAKAQDRERQAQSDRMFQEEKLADGLRNLEVLRAGASPQPQPQVVEERQPIHPQFPRDVHESIRHDEGCDPISDLSARCCSQHGLGAERVGGATNPGPPCASSRSRAVSSPTRFSTWLDPDSDVRDTIEDEINLERSVPSFL